MKEQYSFLIYTKKAFYEVLCCLMNACAKYSLPTKEVQCTHSESPETSQLLPYFRHMFYKEHWASFEDGHTLHVSIHLLR